MSSKPRRLAFLPAGLSALLVLFPVSGAAPAADLGIKNRLGSTLPLDLTFRDETGKTVRLGEVIRRPSTFMMLLLFIANLALVAEAVRWTRSDEFPLESAFRAINLYALGVMALLSVGTLLT